MKKVLVITDEKKSSLNQCQALINYLKKQKKLNVEYKVIEKTLFHRLPNILIYLFLYIRLFSRKNKYNYSIIISCGRISAPYNLILKKDNYRCKNIHILDPYFARTKFEKILIPSHDLKKISKFSSNILEITGTLSYKKKLFKSEIDKFNKISSGKRIISCLIGGDGRSSKFSIKDIDELIRKINLISDSFKVVYCFSRRTSLSAKKMITKKKNPKHSCYDYFEYNPYWYLIEKSSYFIVSEDSVSMISDAISTGKPVYILKVTKLKRKIRKFIDLLKVKGVLREFDGKVSSWNYNKINEASRISKIIAKLF